MATEPRDKLRDLIEDIKIGMLTTMDGAELRSRPMWAVQVDKDTSALWFFTHASSHKVDEIKSEQRVNVSFSEPKTQDYVSVSGTAMLVRDKARAQAMWKEAFRTWFPKGVDDPDLALLHVTPTQAEYWDSPSSTMVHAYGYVKAALTGQSPDPGDNQKINLA